MQEEEEEEEVGLDVYQEVAAREGSESPVATQVGVRYEGGDERSHEGGARPVVDVPGGHGDILVQHRRQVRD